MQLKMVSRKWCFTLNNYNEADKLRLAEAITDGLVSFLLYAEEIAPTTGTPHLQGYLEIAKKKTGRSLKNLLAISNLILIKTKGDLESQKKYCSKSGELISMGVPMQQGARTDLAAVKLMLEDGTQTQDIADAYFGTWCRYRQSFDIYRHLVLKKPRTWMPEIYIYWGRTGLGKTKKVHDDNKPEDIWSWNGNHKFYQGYDMHDVALFDDFYGGISLPYMLKLCDQYPMIVNIKNGECNWQPTKIYFTSNIDPRQWWPDEPQAKTDAFFRRVREFGGGIVHFDSLE